MSPERPVRFLDQSTPPHIATLILLAGLSALAMNIFLPSLPGMTAHAKEWAAELAKQPDLAANLAGFIRGRQSANRT